MRSEPLRVGVTGHRPNRLPEKAWGRIKADLAQVMAEIEADPGRRQVAYARPFDAWMKQRAAAEIARIDLFGHIARAEEASTPDELPTLPLKLEYFRRYQLDVQRRYYRGRGEQHAVALWRNNRWLGTSLAITAVAVLLAALASLRFAASISGACSVRCSHLA